VRTERKIPKGGDITVQGEILEKFRRKLEEADEFDDTIVSQLYELLGADKKPDAAELIKVLSNGNEKDLS
jgi:hypothetical protein